jgi:phage terminase small subunit
MARTKELLLTKVPTPPDYLEEIGRAHWRETMRSLIDMKLATELDKPVIAMACTQWERFRTAQTSKDQQDAITAYLRIMGKYGATPKDRKIMKLASMAKKKPAGDTDIESEFGV